MSTLTTRASSINRAMDQIGDKWCLLILQEVFWGINSFNEMMAATGASRGVLSDRLKWLASVGCLRKADNGKGGKRMRYYLTPKALELYDNALMALAWERRFFSTPKLDDIALTHVKCGKVFTPELRCRYCKEEVEYRDVSYKPGPGATIDEREKKVRRRSSIAIEDVPSDRALYRNLVNVVGDRWTANVIALAFHGITQYDQFLQELPVATNILADRLKFLVDHGIFAQVAYQQRPTRYKYILTEKGEGLYPYFLTLLQWGDKWCDPTGAGRPMRLTHKRCGRALRGQVTCSECGGVIKPRHVQFSLGD